MSCFKNYTNDVTENLVFLNKVFYDNSGTSCPLIYPLTTNAKNYTQHLIIGQNECGCGCRCNGYSCNSCFDLCNAVFTVTNSCVSVTAIKLGTGTTFNASDVTIDGLPVTSLTLQDGRYYADLSGIMAEITDCPGTPKDRHICAMENACDDCNIQCDNDGHFFLAEVPGPWELCTNIVLEGYVSNGRCTTDFKLCIKSESTSGCSPIEVAASNNFALSCVNIPCQSQGIAPALRFNFDACAMLLNPVITIETPVPPSPSQASVYPDPTQLILTASLVITPKINLQVVRPSLFALNATEVDTCCDDLGQCDACSAAPMPPISHVHNSCEKSNHSSCTENGPRNCGAYSQIACQCCETNGYRF